MLLTELLTPDRVKVHLEAGDKESLLRELVDLVVDGGSDDIRRAVLGAVREREAVLSTGIGNGVAIPHGKTSAIPELRLAAGVTADPVDFDALDGRPVRLFFLLVGPESSAGPHVKALSRISRLVRKEDVRARLLDVRTADEFFRTLRDLEGA